MPRITVVDFMGDVQAEFEVEKGTKLLNALIDNGIEIVHTCGGKARCTTCRVNIDEGTPTKETQAQRALFDRKVRQGLPQFMAPKYFLSCQLLVEHDMKVCPMELFNLTIHDNLGKDVEDDITPEPEWVERLE
ncbi:MAG: 2Fe-2S iron-sulfur cluster-binding protein [Candidatus Thorarchaeota archaeon]